MSPWWQREVHGVVCLSFCVKAFSGRCGGSPRGWNSRTFVRTRLGPMGSGVIFTPAMPIGECRVN